MDREFRVQKALYSLGFPVPQPLLLCTDPQVIGTEFYLMEHVKAGFIASQAFLILLVLACALISCRLAQYICTVAFRTRNNAYFELNLSYGQGRIFRDLRLPGVSAAERAALNVAAVEVLARLHSLDMVSLDLKGYGKGSGYCKRQVGEDVALCK